MQRLWSPWRSQYVSAGEPRAEGCIFCRFPQEDNDKENLLIYRGEHTFAVLNRFPYNSGHLMIVPYQHASDFHQLPAHTRGDMMHVLELCLTALGAAFKPDGYNTGMNLGAAAGAGIADHLHMHVVPRWTGDTNFMPVLSDVKVMPEMLEDSYHKLIFALRNEESSDTAAPS